MEKNTRVFYYPGVGKRVVRFFDRVSEGRIRYAEDFSLRSKGRVGGVEPPPVFDHLLLTEEERGCHTEGSEVSYSIVRFFKLRFQNDGGGREVDFSLRSKGREVVISKE